MEQLDAILRARLLPRARGPDRPTARRALDIAKRSLQTVGQIFRYAVAHGKADNNPAKDISPADVLKPRGKRENHASIPVTELPALLRKAEGYPGSPTTRLAVKLMPHAGHRCGTSVMCRARMVLARAAGSTRAGASQSRQRPMTYSINPLSGERANRRCKRTPWGGPCWSGARSPQMAR